MVGVDHDIVVVQFSMWLWAPFGDDKKFDLPMIKQVRLKLVDTHWTWLVATNESWLVLVGILSSH